jgi:molecular chaperone DnaK
MGIQIGIDLGTSNVVVAYMRGNELNPFYWGTIGQDVQLPAFVQYCGSKALVGVPARTAWSKAEEGCYRRFKMHIGREQHDASVSAEHLMTLLAEAIRNALLGNETLITSVKGIESVVITVPHGWKENQRRATRNAVEKAGLTVRRLLSEPVAAAAYYAYARKITAPETVLVCDMGGGTFDITLTRVEPGRKIRVLEHGSETNLYAGTYADALIAQHILQKAVGQMVATEQLLQDQENTEIRTLFRSIEKARHDLNQSAVEYGPEDTEPEDVRFSYQGRRREELSYQDMVSLIAPVCHEAERLTGNLLRQFPGLKLNGVVLAGGMSKMLAVQEAIARATGFAAEDLRQLGQESDRAIAYGAALVAADKVQVDEVLPCGIGIIGRDYDDPNKETNRIVLPRGTRVPSEEVWSPELRTMKQQTRTLELRVGFGDDEDPEKCDVLTRSIEVDGFLEKHTAFQFILQVDENLLLTVRARQRKKDGTTEEIPLKIDLKDVWRGTLQFSPPTPE